MAIIPPVIVVMEKLAVVQQKDWFEILENWKSYKFQKKIKMILSPLLI